MNQAEAARVLGLRDTRAVRYAEKGYTDARPLLATLPEQPEPTRGELCALARRREGWGALTVAVAAVGVSRVAYLYMERTGDQRVALMWRRRGYIF